MELVFDFAFEAVFEPVLEKNDRLVFDLVPDLVLDAVRVKKLLPIVIINELFRSALLSGFPKEGNSPTKEVDCCR